MINYIEYKLKDLSNEAYNKMLDLNLGPTGYSLGHMKRLRASNCDDTYVCMAYNDQELIGWAMTVPQYKDGVFEKYGINFFVKETYRCIHIGSDLFGMIEDLLVKINRRGYVVIWSKDSEYFYNKNQSELIQVVISPKYLETKS